MALTSPGVEVTIIDQSQYLPAPGGSVPLIVFATAQNKANPTGTAVAPGTTAANAGKLYQITSQADLVNFYGTPFFYTTTAGTPIQGYELNEYGLLAAYSALGITNRVYTLRADIDLASLVGSVSRPSGAPTDGEYWLDTTNSKWGIFQFNAVTGQFTEQTPIVISDTAYLNNGVPIDSIGNIGSYAINATVTAADTDTQQPQYFYKTIGNNWVTLGNYYWQRQWSTVLGTNSNPVLTPGNTFTISLNGQWSVLITVPDDGGGFGSVTGVAAEINDIGSSYIIAQVTSSGQLEIFSTQPSLTGNQYIGITNGTGTALTQMGIAVKNYYQPQVVYGTSAQMPLWSSTQTYPHPTGSVWIKASNSGSGVTPVVARYSSALATWQTKQVTLATNDWSASNQLDSTGGKAIPAGTVYAQYNGDAPFVNQATPINLWERAAVGPTAITGTETNFVINLPTFTYTYTAGSFLTDTEYTILTVGNTDWVSIGAASNTIGVTFTATGPGSGTGTATYTLALSTANITVQTSIPNSSALSSLYNVLIPDNCTPTQFVTAWLAGNIPYTNALVTTDGAVQLIHTQGGEIVMNDFIDTFGSAQGQSSTVIVQAGFGLSSSSPGITSGLPITSAVANFYNIPTTTISGDGAGLIVNVSVGNLGNYMLTGTGIATPGINYQVGDQVSVSGALLGGTSPANDLTLTIISSSGFFVPTAISYVTGTANSLYNYKLSNWVSLDFTASLIAPVAIPTNGTNWFYSVVDQVDIMVQSGGQWNGYRNINYDSNGFPQPSGSNTTDPAGPIISATAPETQSDGTALAYGDLWIDTSDLEIYPIISRWEYDTTSLTDTWVLIDNADQTSSQGVLFADARWGSSGAINPVTDPVPTIVSLLTSDYLDLDAPDPALYPTGTLLFNTRRSGYNVKAFTQNYFTSTNYPDAGQYNPSAPTNDANLPEYSYTWVTASGLQANGAPYMGRQAQRNMVVQSLRSVIDSNYDIRDEDNFFNLIATPQYPELQPNMVVLNTDRGETGYILGDTPMRLPSDATSIQAWANNTAGATSTGEAGLVTRNTYLGLFYPSGITSDLSGNLVAVPPSHMMLRTFLRNDNIAYPWFAVAGTRRGNIDNATNIGYIDATTGEFITTKTRIGIRDVLYINFINPLVFFTGIGLLNYGNKTSYNSSSALDRTNVARLIAYVRRQLTLAARPFVFEPNDAVTRNQIAGVIQTLLVDLKAKRGIYDYLVVCDESNNTPARIDRNELWVDVAIEPVKAAEFIYIPVRVLNTGEIASLG